MLSNTYDASGNRLTFDKTSLSQRSYGYLPGNISWYSTSNNAFAEYTHDNNGNILSKTGNRVTDYTMTYDGFNRLVCEISGESVTVYKYGNRLFGFEKDGVKKYYNFNGHGDVTGITNSAYTLIKSYEYDAFGVEKNPDPADTNPFRYCAEYYDTETGYIYLRARYYDVRDGRFISDDPAKDGLNWYVYCGNNPVNFIDPSGNNAGDILFGAAQALDENNLGGAVGWLANKFGKGYREIDLKYDYYLGRVIGDALSALYGAGVSASGICEIIGSIVAGSTVTVGSGGTLAVGGVSISVAGAATGTATAAYGGTVVMMSAGKFGSDVSKMQQAGMNNKRIMNETKIKGHKVSMDLEKGGSGQNNIHVKVDGKKYFFNANKGAFLDSAGQRLPKALQGNQQIINALGKATKLISQGW